MAVAQEFGLWVVVGKSDPVPSLDTPDLTPADQMVMKYPSVQCRVDTVVHGALCPTKFRGTDIPGLLDSIEDPGSNPPESEAAAAPDSCVDGPGARPACWFKPNPPTSPAP